MSSNQALPTQGTSEPSRNATTPRVNVAFVAQFSPCGSTNLLIGPERGSGVRVRSLISPASVATAAGVAIAVGGAHRPFSLHTDSSVRGEVNGSVSTTDALNFEMEISEWSALLEGVMKDDVDVISIADVALLPSLLERYRSMPPEPKRRRRVCRPKVPDRVMVPWDLPPLVPCGFCVDEFLN